MINSTEVGGSTSIFNWIRRDTADSRLNTSAKNTPKSKNFRTLTLRTCDLLGVRGWKLVTYWFNIDNLQNENFDFENLFFRWFFLSTHKIFFQKISKFWKSKNHKFSEIVKISVFQFFQNLWFFDFQNFVIFWKHIFCFDKKNRDKNIFRDQNFNFVNYQYWTSTWPIFNP